ncbi:unnamed protein product [Miscanthus lutarioriparius]|uniref:CCHC-type domain-containing protein n=1 Tax=Miscanthus lutarioriparius TaxID=422564 RepID=A0A811PVH7_9POAL|nr:unnamed protein product [Miscanthus lutarioriparius]
MAEAERQLVVVVEGTAALGPYWSTIVTDYVEKITRYGGAPLRSGLGGSLRVKLGAGVSWMLNCNHGEIYVRELRTEDPDPDQLLPVLVPAPNPTPAISAPSPSSHCHQPPDPNPLPPDLHIDGSHPPPLPQPTINAGRQSPAPSPVSSPEDKDSQIPASPTEIDQEIQEQAWALLPDLARDLCKLKNPCSGTEACSLDINPRSGLTEKTVNESAQAKTKEPQEGTAIDSGLPISRTPETQERKQAQGTAGIHGSQETARGEQTISSTAFSKQSPNPRSEPSDIEDNLLRCRFPASQKGKQVLATDGIHGGQTTGSDRQPTSSASAVKTVPSGPSDPSGTRLQAHQFNTVISEKGWEPAKSYRRKRTDSNPATAQTSNPTRDRSVGSAFVKSKMEGRCFNCFSPKHIARLCTSSPRCWKCFHSGHRADGCNPNRQVRHVKSLVPSERSSHSNTTKFSFPPEYYKSARSRRDGGCKVVKHFPEQYLVIFFDPAIRRHLVNLGVLSDRSRDFHFVEWSEHRYANNVSWEYRVKVRIEGIPVHCWAEDVAAKALGKSCAVHYVEETTRRRKRTRSFDLWAWCCDPCDIPTEVCSRGLSQTGSCHRPPSRSPWRRLTTTTRRPQARPCGPPNRKARREFIWSYGVLDTEGEHHHDRRGNNRGRDLRCQPRRDDDDYDYRRHHGTRRHRSLSSWARNARCRGGVEDCISSNRWRGRRESPPRRSRVAQEHYKAPTQVWMVKARKVKKVKRVSFANPIASELKPPKRSIPDDSIMLIKGNPCSELQYCSPDPVVPESSMPNPSFPVATNNTLEHTKTPGMGEVIFGANIVHNDDIIPNRKDLWRRSKWCDVITNSCMGLSGSPSRHGGELSLRQTALNLQLPCKHKVV